MTMTATAPVLDYPLDTGCYLSPHCSTCPFDKCLLEEVPPCRRKEYIKNTAPLPEPEPEPEPEPVEQLTPTWHRPDWWAKKYLPPACPHCGSTLIGMDGYPDECYCLSCHSSSILPYVPLPKGYHPPRPAMAVFNR